MDVYRKSIILIVIALLSFVATFFVNSGILFFLLYFCCFGCALVGGLSLLVKMLETPLKLLADSVEKEV